MGGCSEALYHGVPMIAVPQAVDQFGNAALLEHSGWPGRCRPGHPESLRSALLEVTESAAVRERLDEASAELREYGGAASAADLLDEEMGRAND